MDRLDFLYNAFLDIVDWIYGALIAPLFAFMSKALEQILLYPMDTVGIPIGVQIVIIGTLAAILSQMLRKASRVDKKEEAFRKMFMEKKAEQEHFKMISDWKKRQLLYETSDKELDELFNTYLAQRFSRYGLIYLLPIFLTLFWLDTVRPARLLEVIYGHPFAVTLPDNPFNIPGLSIPAMFIVSYLIVTMTFFSVKKRIRSQKVVPKQHISIQRRTPT